MMTLIVRRHLPEGKTTSSFYRFHRDIDASEQASGLHLIVRNVEGEAGAPIDAVEIDLGEGDAAHVVDSGGATVTTFRARPAFGMAAKRKAS